MHVKDHRAFARIQLVTSRLELCSQYAAEMDIAESLLQGRPEDMQLPEGQSLQDLLPDRTFQQLNRFCQRSFGHSFLPYNHLLPLVALNAIGEQFLSTDQHESLDLYLWNLARSNQLPCIGLESYEEQKALLQSIPVPEQVQALKSAVRNWSAFRKQFLIAADLYEAGRLQQLYLNTKKRLGNLRRPLLYRRNHLMAARIPPLAAEQATFFTIGVGHLFGEKGVLRLLKHQGITLEPVEKWDNPDSEAEKNFDAI